MHSTDGGAKYVCDYHGVKLEFISEMVDDLRNGRAPEWSQRRYLG